MELISVAPEIVTLGTVPLIMEAPRRTVNVDPSLLVTKHALGHSLVVVAQKVDTVVARMTTAVPLTATQGRVQSRGIHPLMASAALISPAT